MPLAGPGAAGAPGAALPGRRLERGISSPLAAAGRLPRRCCVCAFCLEVSGPSGAVLCSLQFVLVTCPCLRLSPAAGFAAPVCACPPLPALQVDSRADNLQTPLMWAAIRGNVEMCAMLLEHGAALEARDSLGATPLVLTVQHAQHLTFL